jgi:hypothetical protein
VRKRRPSRAAACQRTGGVSTGTGGGSLAPPLNPAAQQVCRQAAPSPWPIARWTRPSTLGGAISREALSTGWTEVKGKFGSQLHGLRPLIGLENRFGYAPYRLVVGPLADEATARNCAPAFPPK